MVSSRSYSDRLIALEMKIQELEETLARYKSAHIVNMAEIKRLRKEKKDGGPTSEGS